MNSVTSRATPTWGLEEVPICRNMRTLWPCWRGFKYPQALHTNPVRCNPKLPSTSTMRISESSTVGHRTTNDLPPPYPAVAQPEPAELSQTSQTSKTTETTTEAKTLTKTERNCLLNELEEQTDQKLLAIKEEAQTKKANSKSRKALQAHYDRSDANIRFRVRKTRPAFRWLHTIWAFFAEIHSSEFFDEYRPIKASIQHEDRVINDWAKKEKKKATAKWHEERKRIEDMPVVS